MTRNFRKDLISIIWLPLTARVNVVYWSARLSTFRLVYVTFSASLSAVVFRKQQF